MALKYIFFIASGIQVTTLPGLHGVSMRGRMISLIHFTIITTCEGLAIKKISCVVCQVCLKFNFLLSQPISTKFDTDPTPCQLTLKMYEYIWFRFMQVCPKSNFLNPDRFSPNLTPTPSPTHFENVPNSSSGMFKVELSSFSTDFYQIWLRPNTQPLANCLWKCISDSGSGMKKIRQLSYSLPTDFENVPSFMECPKYNFLFSQPILTKFDTNPTFCALVIKIPTLWQLTLEMYLIQVQNCCRLTNFFGKSTWF